MKRLKVLLLLLLLAPLFPLKGVSGALRAQVDLHILNHLAVGVEVGTMGVGVDAAMPVTPFVDVQGGFYMFPRFTFNTTLETMGGFTGLDEVRMTGKPMLKGGKVLVNVMPIPMLTSFHVTAGVYIGEGDIMGLTQKSPELAAMAAFNALNPDSKSGVVLGDYLFTPDARGLIDGRLKAQKVKPYVGIGIGRGVPKHRIGFKMDLGCVFWGAPSVYCNDEEIFDTNAGGDDGGVMKLATKLKFYPVLNLRVCGKIF